MITVYVSIGNSDDHLTQADWSSYVQVVRNLLRQRADQVHGEWYSAPDAAYQNACFCAELNDADVPVVRQALTEVRKSWRQDSVAWAQTPVTVLV